MDMTRTLWLLALFLGALALLPWLIRRLRQQQAGLLAAAPGVASRVLSAVAVGPQQRVVTVEAGSPEQRVVLVLGVTAQQITCLHVLPAAPAQAPQSETALSTAKGTLGNT